MVICLERDADLHTAQLMPLPLTVSCFSKIQIGFTFLVPAHPGSPRKRAVKRVCVCVSQSTQRRSSATADGPCDMMCQLKSCQLLHTNKFYNREQIEVMELEGYSRPTCNKLVHPATMRSAIVGVIYRLYRRRVLLTTPSTCCGEIF